MPSSCSRSAGRPARDMPAGVEGGSAGQPSRAGSNPPTEQGGEERAAGRRESGASPRAPLGRTGSWGLEPLFEGFGKLVWNPDNPAIAKEGRTFPESALEIIDKLAEAGKDAWPDLSIPFPRWSLECFCFEPGINPGLLDD